MIKPARQAHIHHVHPMDTWTLTLNRYQRNNLLYLLNVCGYPFGNPHAHPDMQFQTGDWIGEIANMLAKAGVVRNVSINVIDDEDAHNGLPPNLRIRDRQADEPEDHP